MRLSELIAGLNCRIYNFKDVRVESLEFDSRNVKPGSVFIAIPGTKYDGHNFINQAVKQGASAIVAQRKMEETSLPQIIFDDTRMILGKLARNFYGDFSNMKIIGITGTNGKTTTAFLIHAILEQAGYNPGLIGTVYYLSKERVKADRTTPESLDIFKLFNDFRNAGLKSVVMEVSSHALALKRVEELAFDIAVFTNLSQDHLDFHDTISKYKSAKLHLFELLKSNGFAVFNCDDPVSEEIRKLNIENSLDFGFNANALVRGEIASDTNSGLNLNVYYENQKFEIHSKLIGKFNSYNILASVAAGIALQLKIETIIEGVESLEGVRGRMERVGPNVFIDFAHTPGAMANVLTSLREYTEGRVIIVFGCGGNRDREKRSKMGKIASENADFVVVTSDNPRNEEPEKIIKDIISGIKNNNFKVIPDREKAIEFGIRIKKPEDILLIAGKGHEEYQIIGDKVIPFDDAVVVRKILGS
ncbi:MAG: UDP-N-acetylmuramoyl-L-alanyl-D-glutamate--2,6-diaminopimelate ligase [candidate division WOR-3 bacterium]